MAAQQVVISANGQHGAKLTLPPGTAPTFHAVDDLFAHIVFDRTQPRKHRYPAVL